MKPESMECFSSSMPLRTKDSHVFTNYHGGTLWTRGLFCGFAATSSKIDCWEHRYADWRAMNCFLRWNPVFHSFITASRTQFLCGSATVRKPEQHWTKHCAYSSFWKLIPGVSLSQLETSLEVQPELMYRFTLNIARHFEDPSHLCLPTTLRQLPNSPHAEHPAFKSFFLEGNSVSHVSLLASQKLQINMLGDPVRNWHLLGKPEFSPFES